MIDTVHSKNESVCASLVKPSLLGLQGDYQLMQMSYSCLQPFLIWIWLLNIISMEVSAANTLQKISNDYIEITKYESDYCRRCNPQLTIVRCFEDKSLCVKILYRSKRNISTHHKIIIDCFDNQGQQVEGNAVGVEVLSAGEVRSTELRCPSGAKHFNLRVD